MRLLFDENLSFRLVRELADVYPGSAHVRDMGLLGAADQAVWAYATCRPVLIVQADAFSRSRINTVIATVVTSNLRLAQAPGNVRLSKRASGLKKEAVINVSQLITLDKSFLSGLVILLYTLCKLPGPGKYFGW